jgi:hypothetical protein
MGFLPEECESTGDGDCKSDCETWEDTGPFSKDSQFSLSTDSWAWVKTAVAMIAVAMQISVMGLKFGVILAGK